MFKGKAKHIRDKRYRETEKRVKWQINVTKRQKDRKKRYERKHLLDKRCRETEKRVKRQTNVEQVRHRKQRYWKRERQGKGERREEDRQTKFIVWRDRETDTLDRKRRWQKGKGKKDGGEKTDRNFNMWTQTYIKKERDRYIDRKITLRRQTQTEKRYFVMWSKQMR